MTEEMWTAYVHRQCGHIACYKIGKPWAVFDVLMASEVRWPDGRWGAIGDPFVCGSCGSSFHSADDLIPRLYEHVEGP